MRDLRLGLRKLRCRSARAQEQIVHYYRSPLSHTRTNPFLFYDVPA